MLLIVYRCYVIMQWDFMADGFNVYVDICDVLPQIGTGLLCLLFYLLCYAAVLIKFNYYAQNYAQE